MKFDKALSEADAQALPTPPLQTAQPTAPKSATASAYDAGRAKQDARVKTPRILELVVKFKRGADATPLKGWDIKAIFTNSDQTTSQERPELSKDNFVTAQSPADFGANIANLLKKNGFELSGDSKSAIIRGISDTAAKIAAGQYKGALKQGEALRYVVKLQTDPSTRFGSLFTATQNGVVKVSA